jgi:hypothetical protein
MSSRLALGLLALAACSVKEPDRTPTRGPMPPDPVLTVSARCRDAGCPLTESDIFIDVTLTNRTSSTVEVPVAYLAKTGPVIRLVDRRTGAETFLRKKLADPELRARPTALSPGGTTSFAWVIFTSELRQFGGPLDVSAEITIATDITVDGTVTKFTGASTLQFTEP